MKIKYGNTVAKKVKKQQYQHKAYGLYGAHELVKLSTDPKSPDSKKFMAKLANKEWWCKPTTTEEKDE